MTYTSFTLQLIMVLAKGLETAVESLWLFGKGI